MENPHAEQVAVPSPTLGRIVHFYPPAAERTLASDCYPAIVTEVRSPLVVSVCTFGPRSLYFHSDVSHGDKDDDGAHWRWPPRNAAAGGG